MEDSRKAADIGRKEAEKARAYLNSAEYKQIMENARRESEKSQKLHEFSPEYKQIMENAKRLLKMEESRQRKPVNILTHRNIKNDGRKQISCSKLEY